MSTETDQAYSEIMNVIIPEVLNKFAHKAKDYSGGPIDFTFLGSKGQLSDITRKYWKLFAAVWEGKELDFEQPEELAMDLAGNCFLLIYCLRNELELPDA